MLATQMGEFIKNKIYCNVQSVFASLGVTFSADDIWNDLAQIGSGYLKATFYIKGLENVIRKNFNAAAHDLKSSNNNIKEFKVKFKRPEKEVRFYLEMSDINHDS